LTTPEVCKNLKEAKTRKKKSPTWGKRRRKDYFEDQIATSELRDWENEKWKVPLLGFDLE